MCCISELPLRVGLQHTVLINAATVDATMHRIVRMSLAFSGSSEVQCFERSDAIEICDRMIYNLKP